MKRLTGCISAFTIISLLFALPGFAQIEFTRHSLPSLYNKALAVCAGDINGDGNLEILASGRHLPIVIWWNYGEHNPRFPVISNLFHTYYGTRFVRVADFNGDGRQDILTLVDPGGPVVPILFENRFSNEQQYIQHVLYTYSNEHFMLDIDDLDNDGDLDFITNSGCDSIAIYNNHGDMNFTVQTIFLNIRGGSNYSQIGDIDGDGLADIVIAAGDGIAPDLWQGYIWIKNLGDFNFADPEPLNIQDGAQTWAKIINLVDFDADGDLDVIGTPGRSGPLLETNAIYWLENDGQEQPSFIRHFFIRLDISIWSLIVVDLNNDNALDMVVAEHYNIDNGSIHYLLNDGNQNFDYYLIDDDFNTPMSLSCLYSADLDNDGDQDFIGGPYHGSTVFWYENRFIP